jgi:hypothetical protein
MQSSDNILPTRLSISVNDDPVAAAGTLTSDNTNVSNNETVTIGSTVYTFKTTLTGAANEVLIGANADASLTNLVALINSGRAAVAASATLTSDNTNPANTETVVVGAKTYTFKTTLTEVFATQTLTSDETNVSDGDTVKIGRIIYVFKTTLNQLPYEVLIGASAAATLDNLKAAINASGTEGTTYGRGTVAHPQVTATTNTDTTQVIQAISSGTAGNTIVTTETSSHLAWGAATLANGANAVANEVKIGADADTTLANLKAAINGASGSGTLYSSATVASTEVIAGAIAAHALALTARTAGIAGNSLASTETSTHLSYGAATFAGGVAVTAAHTQVSAAAVAAHATVVTARTANFAGNAIVSTETSAHLSWGAATLAGGGSTVGTSAVGGQGGRLHSISGIAPNFTGTPTYTVSILNSASELLYVSSAQNENTTTRAAVDMMLSPDDIVKITTNAKVEETLPLVVELR